VKSLQQRAIAVRQCRRVLAHGFAIFATEEVISDEGK
jgi:hypothetical protein